MNTAAAAHRFGARQVERREAQRPRGGLRNPADGVTRAPRETDSQSVLVTARGRTSRKGSSCGVSQAPGATQVVVYPTCDYFSADLG